VQILTLLALAQMPWTTHLPPRGLALDFLRPKFDAGSTSLTSAAGFLSARLGAGSGFNLRLELPFAHAGGSSLPSSTALGNPYLGVESSRGRLSYELGFRPALTPDDEIAPQIGFYSDVSRLEAFIPHLATLAGRITYRHQTATGMTVTAGGGPSGWIPTAGGDAEIILHHYGSIGFSGSQLWGAVGLGGIFILTEDLDLGERTLYQLGGSIGLARGQGRPALHFIVPLDDDINSAVNFVVGAGVAITLR
jgi:hypothetical protein